MAITKSSDFQVQKMYTGYIQEAFSKDINITSTGIVTTSATISGLADAETYTGVVRYYGNVNPTINIQDESTTDAVPDKIATSTMSVIKTARDTSWSVTDLSVVLSNENAMIESSRQAAFARAADEQLNLIDLSRGVLADNSANDSGDALTVIAKLATGAAATANRLSRDPIVNHVAKMEGSPSDFVMFINYPTWGDLVKLDSGAYSVRTSENGMVLGNFMGLDFVVNNQVADITSTGTSFLSGAATAHFDNSKTQRVITFVRRASVAYSPIALPVPVETDRDILAGEGSGTSTVVYRWAHCIHPLGYDYTGATTAYATNALYKAAGSWDRKWNNIKTQGISALVYNA